MQDDTRQFHAQIPIELTLEESRGSISFHPDSDPSSAVQFTYQKNIVEALLEAIDNFSKKNRLNKSFLVPRALVSALPDHSISKKMAEAVLGGLRDISHEAPMRAEK